MNCSAYDALHCSLRISRVSEEADSAVVSLLVRVIAAREAAVVYEIKHRHYQNVQYFHCIHQRRNSLLVSDAVRALSLAHTPREISSQLRPTYAVYSVLRCAFT